jgi:hypothetical protein
MAEKREEEKKMTSGFNYADLKSYWRKGLRNGNWRKLSYLKKSFYRAALWYARVNVKGRIVNGIVVAMLEDIIGKLAETVKDRIFRVGLAKAEDMQKGYEEVFKWAPELKEWLRDPDYIFWLGICHFKNRMRKGSLGWEGMR